MRVLYLHGFASGPSSRKARFFQDRLQSIGLPVEIPCLDRGNFEKVTLSDQLTLCEDILRSEPGVLIGSSMGGYLASLYAAKHPEVAGLILLAPAFAFSRLWDRQLTPEQFTSWKRNGTMSVFHYASGREMPIGYGMLEDARQFPPYPDVRQPMLIFHGNQDASVPVQESVRFADSHPNADLVRVESGHELTDVLESIWVRSEPFLRDLMGWK